MKRQLAPLLVFLGLAVIAAGVWLLAGVGWGLIAVGAAAVMAGMFVIDVEP